ncbi:MAG: 50S ribosomal protein L6 [Candidatus Omnitrophica bacterium]|nr:50S ribosomal protein L6 [Candidatus Omnitrophota bacterium]MDD5654093.1 50S ribosomal protein L6 [Candidatus Omnitrophota bacterium]
MSRIGKKPVAIPNDVKVEVAQRQISVQGPKGKLLMTIPGRIIVEVKDGQAIVTRPTDIKVDKAMHGLVRMLIVNMITGVTQGYSKELEVVGVGFRAAAQGKALTMQLGFSHPVVFTVPEGIQIETPKQTQIVIRGIDKELVGVTAAKLRAIYPPEPYKGKGIRFAGEIVRKKVGKAAATK